MSVRWRLARVIAPVPIMADPFPGDGVFITQRTGKAAAHFRVATLDLEIKHEPPEPRTWADRFAYKPARRHGTFSGTLA